MASIAPLVATLASCHWFGVMRLALEVISALAIHLSLIFWFSTSELGTESNDRDSDHLSSPSRCDAFEYVILERWSAGQLDELFDDEPGNGGEYLGPRRF